MDKRCSRCGQTKPLFEFGKDANKKDGLKSWCKICDKEYYKKNRDKIIEKFKQRFENNPERIREAGRKTYAKHREQKIKKVQWWAKNNPEKKRRYSQNSLNAYPERWKARRAVAHAIRAGKLPKVSTLDCRNCGGRASEYHHYLGYAKEHWLDVHPYCAKCHKQADKTNPC